MIEQLGSRLRVGEPLGHRPQFDQLPVDLHRQAIGAEHEQAVERGVHRGLQQLQRMLEPMARCLEFARMTLARPREFRKQPAHGQRREQQRHAHAQLGVASDTTMGIVHRRHGAGNFLGDLVECGVDRCFVELECFIDLAGLDQSELFLDRKHVGLIQRLQILVIAHSADGVDELIAPSKRMLDALVEFGVDLLLADRTPLQTIDCVQCRLQVDQVQFGFGTLRRPAVQSVDAEGHGQGHEQRDQHHRPDRLSRFLHGGLQNVPRNMSIFSRGHCSRQRCTGSRDRLLRAGSPERRSHF